MKRRAPAASRPGAIRDPAEAKLKRLRGEVDRLRAAADRPRGPESLQHEISVYQEELIIQNETLRAAQTALEETRDRFIELYDFAPTGYLTIDANGVILGCNLTAAAMIGKPMSRLEGLTFLGLVDRDDRTAMLRFLQRCRSGRDAQIEAEFLIRTADGARHIQLVCRARAGQNPPTEFFASIIDITDRRQLEHEREQAALEQAALASRLLTAQEDERRRIARNLHDDLGQQATVLRLALEQLSADPAASQLRPRLQQLRESIARLDESLHEISGGLRPSALDLGIVPAIRQLVDDWSASSGVAASLHADDFDDGWLSPDVETHIFRILQELLTNVAKHAAASRVTVVLERLDSGVSLAVEDDGDGFDLRAARGADRGLGLIGIRERLQLVGGQLKIKSGDPRGTLVTLTAPRQPSPPPRAGGRWDR